MPHFVAKKLDGTATKLIHISTDCVFEGTKVKYTESDMPDAASYYGRSKALGEVVDEKNLTIRISIIGPELKPNGIGLYHLVNNEDIARHNYLDDFNGECYYNNTKAFICCIFVTQRFCLSPNAILGCSRPKLLSF